MTLRLLLLLVVLPCASALTSAATCTCDTSPCSDSSTYAKCVNRLPWNEDRNTDVFEPALSSLTSLTHLFLAIDKLTSLPESISGLSELSRLKNSALAINQLTSVPESISGLSELSGLCIGEVSMHWLNPDLSTSA
ncbi:Hypothetical Protein FCC1311_054722 [Hondaea fermentalgiana]|uniref:Uncharacterized protein n=1 Tax=Hondaea fermentalgiana TaxID=2315210 RepID=A0A2R5GE85_9STRA|nr:Hypothetical Protein FCC1311_054722 [Hondaea fermentalgiana]|eukprot:GBG29250.1 Hypothetical Protein FCC1311_054722 [Hondaea fermentalgiana]